MTIAETETAAKSSAEIVRDVMAKLDHHDHIYPPADFDPTTAHLIAVPENRRIEDITPKIHSAAQLLKPFQRKGTAHLSDLDSLIAWANRFKGDTSALFATYDKVNPTLTCIADYHGAGPADDPANPDPTARHCRHRAVYGFPLSDEWTAWTGIEGKGLEKDELGDFIETHARDVMDPTPGIIAGKLTDKLEPWEARRVEDAQKIEGRFGQLSTLMALSRQFQIYETSDLKVSTNRDTGESQIQFLNEHKTADGKPLNIPNLLIIAIPVFEGGGVYRMTVRFRYRKMGSTVRFFLSIYNPEKAFKDAIDIAVAAAHDQTGLPVFRGTPES